MSVDGLRQNKMTRGILLNYYNIISAIPRCVNALFALLRRYAVSIGS
jgi:hypothetical protein